MNRRRFCLTIGTLSSMGQLLAANSRMPLIEEQGAAFGSTIRFVLRHPSPTKAQEAIRQGFAEIELIESLMSLYRPTSQLSILNRQGELPSPHPYLVEVLQRAEAISVATDGAFDVTIQPLWQLHTRASQVEKGRGPSTQSVKHARRRIGYRNIELRQNRIRLLRDAKVTLNGIAQGFATDRIKQVLQQHGIKHALVDVGELASLGTKDDSAHWQAGIQHPRDKNAFLGVTPIAQDRCLATSGDYATTFTTDFRSHHIFDPTTGTSPAELSSVSVLAPTATEADALSTAFFVMGIERSRALLQHRPSVDALFVKKDGTISASHGFPKLGGSNLN